MSAHLCLFGKSERKGRRVDLKIIFQVQRGKQRILLIDPSERIGGENIGRISVFFISSSPLVNARDRLKVWNI